ncbi:MAG TPA: formate dehydrogenase subunit delta [Steroidobacteraceae bacterium]
MNIQHLVSMANEIGAFFLSEAGEDGAPREIASHITKFWDPRMRAQIIEHAHAGGQGLSAAACKAVLLLAPVAGAKSAVR